MNILNAEERRRQDRLLAAQFGADAAIAREFNRARARVFLHDIIAFLRGYHNHLLSFEAISGHVMTGQAIDRGLQPVLLANIRGSVDRYRDFDLAFLPRHGSLRDRWERVEAARMHGLPMPPVELYKLSDIYFVRDGHHRISVCRHRGDSTIMAHVIELSACVPLHADLTPDDLPEVAAYADFVRMTDVDRLLPHVDLQLTDPRNYARLLRHIALFRYLNLPPEAEPRQWPESVQAWYTQLYRPVLDIVHVHDVMTRFPDRTPTDLYLWLVTYFRQLHDRLPEPDEMVDIEDDLDFYLAPFFSL